MKLRNLRERMPRTKAAALMGQEQAPAPAFSAHDILLAKADALKGDLRITSVDGPGKASLLAKLYLLVPESASFIYDQSAEVFPQRTNDLRGQGHNLLLYIHTFPQVLNFLKGEYSTENLQSHVTRSFDPGIRPDVWPLLVGKVLFPEEGEWNLQPQQTTYLLSWIKGMLTADPSWADQRKALTAAADMVLLNPDLKPALQAELRSVLKEFNTRVKNIFGTATEIVEAAYDLEIIFGDSLSLMETGKLQNKKPGLASSRLLPERQIV